MFFLRVRRSDRSVRCKVGSVLGQRIQQYYTFILVMQLILSKLPLPVVDHKVLVRVLDMDLFWVLVGYCIGGLPTYSYAVFTDFISRKLSRCLQSQVAFNSLYFSIN